MMMFDVLSVDRNVQVFKFQKTTIAQKVGIVRRNPYIKLIQTTNDQIYISIF